MRHLFKYLLAISISLEKYLFHPFINFYLGYLFLLNQVTTLCVLDNILSYIWLGNNVLHTVNCLFAMLIISFSVQKTLSFLVLVNLTCLFLLLLPFFFESCKEILAKNILFFWWQQGKSN